MWPSSLVAFHSLSSLDILAFLCRTRDNTPLQHHVHADPGALDCEHRKLRVTSLVLKAQERLHGVMGHG